MCNDLIGRNECKIIKEVIVVVQWKSTKIHKRFLACLYLYAPMYVWLSFTKRA